MLKQLKIILLDKKTKLLSGLNILIILMYIPLITSYDYFLYRFYYFFYMLIIVIIIIMNQSANYRIYANSNVLIRVSSDGEVYKKIIISDVFLVVYYWILNSVILTVITALLGNYNLSYNLKYYYFMMVWPLFFTCIKHMIYLIIKKYNLASLYISLIIVGVRILGSYYNSIFLSMNAAITVTIFSLLCFIYIINELKKFTFE